MPPPAVRQIEAERQAEHLAGGERGLHDAHHAAAHVERKEVGDDRHRDRADDAAEDPGDDARGEQELVGRREAAEQRAPREARVEEEQQLLAIEAVGEPRGEQARERGAEGVHRHDQAELLGGEVEIAQQDRAQRRDDHEIEDDRELQEGEHADHELLVRREGRRRTRVGAGRRRRSRGGRGGNGIGNWGGNGVVAHEIAFLSGCLDERAAESVAEWVAKWFLAAGLDERSFIVKAVPARLAAAPQCRAATRAAVTSTSRKLYQSTGR